MQLKNNKILVIIFRICILAAFFTGLMYFIKFVNVPDNGSREKAFAALSSFFYAYMVFTVVSFVLSIVCFKTTSIVSSVVRTISLAVTSIVLFLNMSFIGLMNKTLQVQSGDYSQLMELSKKAENLSNSTGIIFLLSFASVFVMLVLFITSVVTLIKTLKGNA